MNINLRGAYLAPLKFGDTKYEATYTVAEVLANGGGDNQYHVAGSIPYTLADVNAHSADAAYLAAVIDTLPGYWDKVDAFYTWRLAHTSSTGSRDRQADEYNALKSMIQNTLAKAHEYLDRLAAQTNLNATKDVNNAALYALKNGSKKGTAAPTSAASSLAIPIAAVAAAFLLLKH